MVRSCSSARQWVAAASGSSISATSIAISGSKAAERFWCIECGARPREIVWVGEGVDPPAGAIWTCFAPYGIDPRSWARAGEDDRVRLIRRRR
jgi:hypothetical protein